MLKPVTYTKDKDYIVTATMTNSRRPEITVSLWPWNTNYLAESIKEVGVNFKTLTFFREMYALIFVVFDKKWLIFP